MWRWIKNVFYLSAKEIRSLFSDVVLVVLIVYMFTGAIYTVSSTMSSEVKNASVAIIDNDHSALSYRLKDSLIPPRFKKVNHIQADEADRLMDMGEYTFVLDIPPNYEQDVLAGRAPQIGLSIDATAMTQAAIGSSYISQIFSSEINEFLHQRGSRAAPLQSVVNVLYNPNYVTQRFMGAMQMVGNLTLLTMLLVGAAVIRERERGTIEHLLVMPVSSSEIAFAKIFANALVLLVVVAFSLRFIAHGLLETPLPDGAMPRFLFGAFIFIFSIAALGIMLAVFAPTMPQFGLLCLPVYIVLNLLAGINSPVENMPETAQFFTQFLPSTIFGSYIQDVIFRGAGFAVVWPKLAKIAAMGVLFLTIALMQFKTMLSKQG